MASRRTLIVVDEANYNNGTKNSIQMSWKTGVRHRRGHFSIQKIVQCCKCGEIEITMLCCSCNFVQDEPRLDSRQDNQNVDFYGKVGDSISEKSIQLLRWWVKFVRRLFVLPHFLFFPNLCHFLPLFAGFAALAETFLGQERTTLSSVSRHDGVVAWKVINIILCDFVLKIYSREQQQIGGKRKKSKWIWGCEVWSDDKQHTNVHRSSLSLPVALRMANNVTSKLFLFCI